MSTCPGLNLADHWETSRSDLSQPVKASFIQSEEDFDRSHITIDCVTSFLQLMNFQSIRKNTYFSQNKKP